MKKSNRLRLLQDVRGLFIISENLATRLNDTLALRKSNYDSETGRFNLWSSKKGKWVSVRALPESKEYIKALPASEDPDPPLFETLYRAHRKKGGPVFDVIKDVMIQSGVRTEVRPISHRYFRRRAALIVGKENPLAAQRFLDHEHLKTTEIYMKAKEDGADEAIEIVKKHAVVGHTKAA